MHLSFIISPVLPIRAQSLSSASRSVSTTQIPDAFKSDNALVTKRRAYHFLLELDNWGGIPRPLGAAGGCAVLWIRGVDLRIRDSVALCTACSEHSSVAPLYLIRGDEDGDTISALRSFRASLRQLGGELFLRRGGTVGDTLCAFSNRISSRTIHTVRGVSKEETRLLRNAECALQIRGIALKQHWDNFVRAPDSLPFPPSKAPTTADSFAQRVCKSKVTAPIAAPESVSCPVNCGDAGALLSVPTRSRPVGEREAWLELDAYFRGHSLASREPSKGVNTSYERIGKLIQLGCISARNVHHQVQKRLKPTSLKYHCAQMELELRDFFRYRALASSKSTSAASGVAAIA